MSVGLLLIAAPPGRTNGALRECGPTRGFRKEAVVDCSLFALQTEEVQKFLSGSSDAGYRRRGGRFRVLYSQALFRYALLRSRPSTMRNYLIGGSIEADNGCIIAGIIIAPVPILDHSHSSKSEKEQVNGNMAKSLFQG